MLILYKIMDNQAALSKKLGLKLKPHEHFFFMSKRFYYNTKKLQGEADPPVDETWPSAQEKDPTHKRLILLTESKGEAGLKMPGSQNTGVKIPYFLNRPKTSYQIVKNPIKNTEGSSMKYDPPS